MMKNRWRRGGLGAMVLPRSGESLMETNGVEPTSPCERKERRFVYLYKYAFSLVRASFDVMGDHR
jgi:hypothetical protein